MTQKTVLSRRKFLTRSAILGCSAAASPLLTPVSFASAPWDTRLIVIILRGGMDGLDVIQPYGDKDLIGTRRKLKFGEAGGATDLDGFFSMHPALSPLMPMWTKGELAFAHAVSTPYRDKRSHFDGQDLLEAGAARGDNGLVLRDGWLNRMLQVVPGVNMETAFAIGREEMLVLKGAAPVANWSPDADLILSPQSRRLLELVYHDDAAFREAAGQAMDIVESLKISTMMDVEGDDLEMMQEMANPKAKARDTDETRVVEFAASRLLEDTRVAAFSINGWDTHTNQPAGISRALGKLSESILTLQSRLGPIWQKTAVLAMTEFGRTVRENGTTGTDHGTGGAMLMAGGAVKGGKVYADWPGLKTGDLYAGRDLMPTADVRGFAASAMQGLFGLDRADLENAVFPNLDMANAPRIIL